MRVFRFDSIGLFCRSCLKRPGVSIYLSIYLAAGLVNLTCISGSSGPLSEAVVLSTSARREGVRVIRVTLISAKEGTNRRGSVTTPSGKMARGTPAKSGVSSSATKSTKHEGVRLR